MILCLTISIAAPFYSRQIPLYMLYVSVYIFVIVLLIGSGYLMRLKDANEDGLKRFLDIEERLSVLSTDIMHPDAGVGSKATNIMNDFRKKATQLKTQYSHTDLVILDVKVSCLINTIAKMQNEVDLNINTAEAIRQNGPTLLRKVISMLDVVEMKLKLGEIDDNCGIIWARNSIDKLTNNQNIDWVLVNNNLASICSDLEKYISPKPKDGFSLWHI